MTTPDRATDPAAKRSGPSAFFAADGDTFVPQPIARGPWGETISGNYVGGILGYVLERDAGEPDFQPARLTVDLFRPAALAPVRVDTTITRQGRRLKFGRRGDDAIRHGCRPCERTVSAKGRSAGRRDLVLTGDHAPRSVHA